MWPFKSKAKNDDLTKAFELIYDTRKELREVESRLFNIEQFHEKYKTRVRRSFSNEAEPEDSKPGILLPV